MTWKGRKCTQVYPLIKQNLINVCGSFTAIMSFKFTVTGICVKTHTEDGGKVFINICQTSELPAPDDISEDTLVKIWSSDDHSSFRVPMSIGESHEEVDKGNLKSMTLHSSVNYCALSYIISFYHFIQISENQRF
jgi:hypothetical protein